MPRKTQATDADVAEFLAAIPDERRRADSEAICRLMAEETGEPPQMWGKGIVGFAEYEELLARLGKHSTGKACLYVKRLADVDSDVLRELIARSFAARV
jgi:hypothetical protein